jgi:membrane fusion protein (multidrug efflux system)
MKLVRLRERIGSQAEAPAPLSLCGTVGQTLSSANPAVMPSFSRILTVAVLLAASALSAWAEAGLVKVVSKPVSKTIDLPGEILPFLSVSLHAKIPGYVERVLVDRGSVVKEGQLLVELRAPELTAQIAEAESKALAVESEGLQAEAQLAAAESTSDRLKEAAKTQGAVSANEVVQAEKQVEAAQALVRARQQSSSAAQAAVQAQRDLAAYLKITAPFAGVITDRLVHPGALVGTGADLVLLVLQQVSHLRLVVPVPEEYVGGVMRETTVSFRVPAYPERNYPGTVARISHELDQKTRTMAVELDVLNHDDSLAPGMYPSVKWPVRRSRPALFVPPSSVVTTTERTFVIRSRNGRAEWVDVKKGVTEGDLVEVIGSIAEGESVVRRATDEIRAGTALK